MGQNGYRRCSVHVLCSPFDLDAMCPIAFDLSAELAPSFITRWTMGPSQREFEL